LAGAPAAPAAPQSGGSDTSELRELSERDLACLAVRDPEAFGQLYDRYAERIYAHVYRRLRSKAEAEDVVSAAFERAIRSMARFRWQRGGFGAWLFRIADNLALDHLRRRKRMATAPKGGMGETSPEEFAGPTEGADGPVDPEAAALRAERARLVWGEVDLLTAGQRDVVLLRYGADFGNSEIAEATGRTATAVSSLLHRALLNLRERLGERHG